MYGMEAVFRLNTRELGNSFITSLRDAYPDQNIEITVREQDETEYLCSSPANRERLETAIENVKQGKIITFETLEQAIQCAEERTAAQ
jgi:antitoxin YefM